MEELGLVMEDLELDQGLRSKMSLYRLTPIRGFKGWELLFVQNIILKLKQQQQFQFQIRFLIKIEKEDNHQLL
jgi:hypothetical protein